MANAEALATAEDTRAATRLGAGGPAARVRVPVRPGLSAGVLLRACRPRQWAKNVLVLAAPCAAGVATRPSVAL